MVVLRVMARMGDVELREGRINIEVEMEAGEAVNS